ncbi:MAG: hypothetical protein ABSE76_02520 [Minisyncoccia bacterium]|jgi:hypothetical protein
MQNRAHSSTWSLVLLFVCIFAFWWGIAVFTQNSTGVSNQQPTADAPSVQYVPQGTLKPVEVQVAFANNTYTYSGSMPLDSSCEELGEGISVNGQNPSHVTILLTLVKPSVACAQASEGGTNEPFSVSVLVASGTKAMLDGLTINGIIIPTTIKSIHA